MTKSITFQEFAAQFHNYLLENIEELNKELRRRDLSPITGATLSHQPVGETQVIAECRILWVNGLSRWELENAMLETAKKFWLGSRPSLARMPVGGRIVTTIRIMADPSISLEPCQHVGGANDEELRTPLGAKILIERLYDVKAFELSASILRQKYGIPLLRLCGNAVHQYFESKVNAYDPRFSGKFLAPTLLNSSVLTKVPSPDCSIANQATSSAFPVLMELEDMTLSDKSFDFLNTLRLTECKVISSEGCKGLMMPDSITANMRDMLEACGFSKSDELPTDNLYLWICDADTEFFNQAVERIREVFRAIGEREYVTNGFMPNLMPLIHMMSAKDLPMCEKQVGLWIAKFSKRCPGLTIDGFKVMRQRLLNVLVGMWLHSRDQVMDLDSSNSPEEWGHPVLLFFRQITMLDQIDEIAFDFMLCQSETLHGIELTHNGMAEMRLQWQIFAEFEAEMDNLKLITTSV